MQKTSLFKASLNYGLMLGGALVVYSLLLYVLGAIGNQAYSYVSFVFYIALMVWGIKEYRDKVQAGFITYGNSFVLGFYIALIGALISAIFTFILFKLIDPSLLQTMLDKVRMQMEEKNNMTEEQIEMAMKMTTSMMSPMWMLIWGFAGGAFFGAIISLIVSIFMKKEGTPFDAPAGDQTTQN